MAAIRKEKTEKEWENKIKLQKVLYSLDVTTKKVIDMFRVYYKETTDCLKARLCLI